LAGSITNKKIIQFIDLQTMKEENSKTPDKTTNSSNTQDVMNAYFTAFDQVVADVEKQNASLELRIMQLQPLRAHSKARQRANANSQIAVLQQRLILLPAEKKVQTRR